MNTGVHPGNHLVSSDCQSFPLSFDPQNCDQEPGCNVASASSEAAGSLRRHLKLVGTHIDVAFARVDILRQLDRRTLERMAIDDSTPVVLLERLAAHPLAEVRAAVSDNQNTPLYTLWALSKDHDPDVRFQLAENHNLPLPLIRSLANDENPYVACRAQQTFDRLLAGWATRTI